MDAEEIQNKLSQLSRANFRKVVSLILKKILLFDSINVDAAGDGGSDWKAFEDHGQRLRLAIQDTVQKQDWEDKALQDAKKARKELGVNRYLFFTNRTHQETTTVGLENNITRATGLACQVFDARTIAELLQERGLGAEFLASIGEAVAAKPPELPEICLCAYGNFSADRRNHRDQIYNDTLLVSCREAKQAPTRDELLDAAVAMLSTTPNQRPLLGKRLDSLLSQRQIQLIPDGRLELTASTKARIAESEQLYLADWAVLESAQAAMMKAYGATWSGDDARLAAVFLARMFIKDQLDLLQHARIEGLTANWSARLGNPEQQLRDLLQNRGVTTRNISKAIEELVDLAKGRDVITKLTRTAIFVALEGRDPMLSATALGRRSWDEVAVLLDSSVAIPFLCEKLNGEVKEYIFALSGHAVVLFQDLKSRALILPGHIEECAAHLIQAYRYEPVGYDSEFVRSLRVSENAFVAFYTALRVERGETEARSLLDFLQEFSARIGSATRQFNDLRQAARSLMPDIQQLLGEYKVGYQQLRRASYDRFNSLQKKFDQACIASKKERHPLLREHDIDALAHLAAATEQNGESWMMLTWDKLLIQVSQNELPSAFVVSPEMAMDFAQPCRRLGETEFCALAHRLGAATPSVDMLTARVIDQVVSLNPDKLHDGAFRKQLLEFRDQARERLPEAESEKVYTWIEGQTTKFLKKHDIVPPTETKKAP
jgi:hypothetical protein